jgi:hypothetical protein
MMYSDFVSTLAAKTFFSEMVDPGWLTMRLAERLHHSKKLDAAKKALFYGKDPGDQVHRNVDGHKYARSPDFIHGVIGVDSEAAELVEVLLSNKTDDELRAKIVDESGDLLFYLFVLWNHFDITLDEAMSKNMEKLRARYPEGFNTHAAIHRNEAKESAVFQ